ncbi:STY0301 family protein [Marilutibacter chinensis]
MAATALASAAFSCPASIEDEQHVQTPPGAASVHLYKGPRKLEYMAVFVGHPTQRLQPQPIRAPQSNVYVWEFASGADVWVQCIYTASAAVITYHVGATRRCSFRKSPGGLEQSWSQCDAPLP